MGEGHRKGGVVSSDKAQALEPLDPEDYIRIGKAKLKQVKGKLMSLDGEGHLKANSVTVQQISITHHNL